MTSRPSGTRAATFWPGWLESTTARTQYGLSAGPPQVGDVANAAIRFPAAPVALLSWQWSCYGTVSRLWHGLPLLWHGRETVPQRVSLSQRGNWATAMAITVSTPRAGTNLQTTPGSSTGWRAIRGRMRRSAVRLPRRASPLSFSNTGDAAVRRSRTLTRPRQRGRSPTLWACWARLLVRLPRRRRHTGSCWSTAWRRRWQAR
jgi:hypothetical protein